MKKIEKIDNNIQAEWIVPNEEIIDIKIKLNELIEAVNEMNGISHYDPENPGHCYDCRNKYIEEKDKFRRKLND